jgi:hypothetical protein
MPPNRCPYGPEIRELSVSVRRTVFDGTERPISDRFGGTASSKGPVQQLEIRDQVLLCPPPVGQVLAA